MRAHIWIGRIKRIMRTSGIRGVKGIVRVYARIRRIEGIRPCTRFCASTEVVLSEQLGDAKGICHVGGLRPVKIVETYCQIICLHKMHVLPIHSRIPVVHISLHVDHLGDLPSSIPRVHFNG